MLHIHIKATYSLVYCIHRLSMQVGGTISCLIIEMRKSATPSTISHFKEMKQSSPFVHLWSVCLFLARPRRALMVEWWKKKHAYIGFVYIPARGCDLIMVANSINSQEFPWRPNCIINILLFYMNYISDCKNILSS